MVHSVLAVSPHGRRFEGTPRGLCDHGTNPIREVATPMTSPHYLPKALPPPTITLGVRISTYALAGELGCGEANIQSVTVVYGASEILLIPLSQFSPDRHGQTPVRQTARAINVNTNIPNWESES